MIIGYLVYIFIILCIVSTGLNTYNSIEARLGLDVPPIVDYLVGGVLLFVCMKTIIVLFMSLDPEVLESAFWHSWQALYEILF